MLHAVVCSYEASELLGVPTTKFWSLFYSGQGWASRVSNRYRLFWRGDFVQNYEGPDAQALNEVWTLHEIEKYAGVNHRVANYHAAKGNWPARQLGGYCGIWVVYKQGVLSWLEAKSETT